MTSPRAGRWRLLLLTCVVVVGLLSLGIANQSLGGMAAEAAGTTYYVSRLGSNGDGRTWATAWKELNQIKWASLLPGDTVLIDGGQTQMVYTTSMVVGKSGTSAAPITLKLASEPGRNGKAVIFGGRSTPLPYCGQTSYSYQTSGVRLVGVDFGNSAYVVLDGAKWRGITIYGHNQTGIKLSSGSSYVKVRNVEIYDNGKATQSGSWSPDQPGVLLSGKNNTFERAIIHDNGQDGFQSGGGVANFTLRESWLYMGRKAPDGSVWNYCRHPDGVQIYGGENQYGVTIEKSIVGPGFMQGVLLGDGGAAPIATVHNVTIRDTLFYGNHNANISSHDTVSKPTGWRIERVTSDRPVGENWHNVYFSGDASQLTIKDSIFTGGVSMSVPAGGAYSGSVQWKVAGKTVGTSADPQYNTSTVLGSTSTSADYRLKSTSPYAGKGTSMTSSTVLLNGAGGVVPPTPTKTPVPAPTATPVPASVLTLEAEAGVINSPFVVSSGTVSQSIETTIPSQGGRASYRFTTIQPGKYVVKARVSTPNTASDSLFINIDGEPTSPTMIWDIGATGGLQDRTASWRGAGTTAAPQYAPKVFTLTAGTHELVIRGREANTRIDRIQIVAVP